MINMNNMSLRGKLILNFLASGGILVAAVIFCLFQAKSLGRATDELVKDWLPSVQHAAEISQLRLRYRVRSLEFMMAEDDAERVKFETSLESLDQSLESALKKYESLISNEEEERALRASAAAVAAYRNTVREALVLVKAGRMEEAQELRRTSWVKAADEVRDRVDDLIRINHAGAEKMSERAEQNVGAAMEAGYLALFVGLVAAVITTLLMVRNLSRRLSATVSAAKQISRGDLTGALPSASKDEVGQLVEAMAEMQQALRKAMSENRDNAEEILKCSTGLEESVQHMEQSANIQSSAASAIATNVEQVTVSINHISESTNEAAQFARDSDKRAQEGHGQIGRLIANIGDIANVVRSTAGQIARLESESKKISNIVAVINDIADQTNLLALNAAIEAARAGEQGRGFAVVADEVRKLSERTAVSTREIATMIGTIQSSTHSVVTEVEQGVALVDQSVVDARQAGEAIASLQEMARKVAQIIADVDVALQEQSSASNDVAKKVEDVATQTEESSSIAQQTLSAAESMSQTARAMQQLAAGFRL